MCQSAKKICSCFYLTSVIHLFGSSNVRTGKHDLIVLYTVVFVIHLF